MFLTLIFTFFILCYLVSRLTLGIAKSATCLIGKTAIITGANSGIGYQVVLDLASRGCRIIMADIADMKVSKNNVISTTRNANIVTKKLDLASFKSVRKFAEDVIHSENHLHILINNAGIGASRDLQTEDQLNPVMQINYFGSFLLTHLLSDLLKKSAPSRIIFTSSMMAFYTNLTPEKLRSSASVPDFTSAVLLYGNSKLATIIAADIFAEKLKETKVTSNSVHPGFVHTGIFSKSFSKSKSKIRLLFSKGLFAIYSKTPWEGAQTTIHCAVSDELKEVTGKHFWDCRQFYKPSSARKNDFCKKVWDVSEECVGLKPEEKL